MPGPPNEHLPGRGIVDLTARSRYMDDIGSFRRNRRDLLSTEERLSLLEGATSIGFLWEIVEVDADITVPGGGVHLRVNTGGGNVTISLPSTVGLEGQMVSIIKITVDANTVTIVPDGIEFLGVPAGADVLAAQWDSLSLIAINSNGNDGWDLLASTI